jgi:hypothetical protein
LALEVLAGCVPLHIDAASIHSRWEAGKSIDLEGKVVFAEGPHPAEPERKWEELAEDDTPGKWFWTDASRKEENTVVEIVRMEAGKFVERRGLRLQDGYPTHMAQLYALGSAIIVICISRMRNRTLTNREKNCRQGRFAAEARQSRDRQRIL